MKKTRFILLLLIVILVGCSTDYIANDTVSFRDSNVSGIEFECNSGATGISDSNGIITYPINCNNLQLKIRNVKLGSIAIGDIKSDKVIYPADLLGLDRNNTTDSKLQDMLQLLQSLDDDSNATNGINIVDTKADKINGIILDFNSSNDYNFSDFNNTSLVLVDRAKALEHYKQTLQKDLNLSEFQTVIFDDMNSFDTSIWQKADWANGSPFLSGWCKDQVSFNSGNLVLTLEDKSCHGEDYASGEFRTQATHKYGRYSTKFQASDINGTISSLFTYTGPAENTDWDEIDIEILGNDTTKMQVNYWRKGNEHPTMINLGFDASASMHEYAFVWHQDYIKWYVDGNLVHTVTENNQDNNDSLPVNAGKIIVNLWAGVSSLDNWSGHYDTNSKPTASIKYDYIKFEKFK